MMINKTNITKKNLQLNKNVFFIKTKRCFYTSLLFDDDDTRLCFHIHLNEKRNKKNKYLVCDLSTTERFNWTGMGVNRAIRTINRLNLYIKINN